MKEILEQALIDYNKSIEIMENTKKSMDDKFYSLLVLNTQSGLCNYLQKSKVEFTDYCDIKDKIRVILDKVCNFPSAYVFTVPSHVFGFRTISDIVLSLKYRIALINALLNYTTDEQLVIDYKNNISNL